MRRCQRAQLPHGRSLLALLAAALLAQCGGAAAALLPPAGICRPNNKGYSVAMGGRDYCRNGTQYSSETTDYNALLFK